LDLILKESNNHVKFNYSCKYCPSNGDDVVETNEGIVQFSLDPMPKQRITRGKGAGINVQAKSLKMYLSEMRCCNYPQLLLISPERQTQVEMMGEKLLKQVIKNCISRKYSSSSHMLTTHIKKRCHTLSLRLLFFLKDTGAGATRHIAKMETQNGTCSMIKISLRSVVISQ